MRKILFFIIMALALGAVGQQSITLVQPAAGSVWDGASTRTIAWQSQNVNLLAIAFSADGGATWQTIVAAYPATAQSYDWVVPAQPTTQGRIRLSDSENPAVYALSGLFTIPDPYITLVQPGTLHTGNAYAIRWQSSCIFNVDLYLSDDGGITWSPPLTGINAVRGYFNWNITAPAGNYLLKISDSSDPDMFAISVPFEVLPPVTVNVAKFRGGSYDGYASFSNQQAELAITYPVGGETFMGSTVQTIRWQKKNTFRIMILLSLDGGITWNDTIQHNYPAEALQYDWKVPISPSEEARIRLVSLDQPNLESISGEFIIPEPFISITNEFTQLYSGTPYPIMWNSSTVNSVSIAYSSDGGGTWQTFASTFAWRGIRNWTVPAPTSQAKLRLFDPEYPDVFDETDIFVISSLPEANPAKYRGGSYDGYSALSNLPAELAITFPAGGETLNGSSVQTIRWERRNTGRIKILLSFDGGLTWNDTIQHNYPAEALQYAWTVPNTASTAARIRLVSLDQPGLESESGDFTIPEPMLAITNAFTELFTGTPYPVFWNSASVSKVNLAFSSDGGSTWTDFAQNVPALQGFKNWTVAAATTQAKIRIWNADDPTLQDETDEFVISSLPETNAAKYRGGSYDGWARRIFMTAAFACPPDLMVCANDPPFVITGATPEGGTFSGAGVSDGTFDPAAAGVGIWPVTYDYTYFNGSFTSCTFTIEVKPVPEVACPADLSVCVDALPFLLSGATPAEGTYSGAGVSNGSFDPAAAGVGDHTITYTFSSEFGCVNSCEFTITVNPLPVMTCPANLEVCVDVASLPLPPAQPEGGAYSGPTVANGIFYPAQAGAGTFEISYAYTDGNGCDNLCTFEITVNPLPVMTCPEDVEICVDGGVIALPAALPAGGTYSGNGVSGSAFDPATAGVGDHLITYRFTDEKGCENSCAFMVAVHPLPVMTCPANLEFCLSDSPYLLTGGLPQGGIYSGSGVSEGVFDPSGAGVGAHEITYYYLDENGCDDDCTFNIEVYPLPVMTCPADKLVCISEAPFELDEALPAGGNYSGPGVTGNVFYPQLAGAGDHTIVYSYIDGNTCTNSCSFMITVKPLPVMGCPSNFSVCQNNGPFQLTGGSPGGGVYSGNGVMNGMFHPASVATGIHAITYTFTDGFGCANSCTFNIFVLPIPEIGCPENMEVCLNGAPFPVPGLSPSGGTLTGTGIIGGVFYPALAGVGDHAMIYSYTSPFNFCTNTCQFVITVLPLPVLTCESDFSVCLNEGEIVLGNSLPAGGTYSGAGVENGIFNPETAGVGSHEILYSYTSPENFCTHACSFVITVLPLPELSCGEDFSVCLNNGTIVLDQVAPAGGNYSGTGVTAGVFDPEQAGVGIHEITYDYTSPVNQCTNSCSFLITVLPLPELVCMADFSVCLNDEPVLLDESQPLGGTYSGPGVESGVFNPAAAGVGLHELVYSYTSPENQCSNTCSFMVTVLPLPQLTCQADFSVCLNEGLIVLDNSLPAGGTYSGAGVENGIFNPEAAGTGSHAITYSYTSPENFCTQTCSFMITVLPLPELSCGEDFSVCLNNGVIVLDQVAPAGGSYSGTGVTAGVFDPELAGVGMHEITYDYTSPVNQCTNSCSFFVTVLPLPELVCMADFSVCLNDEPLLLNDAQPSGGTYSGPGVESGVFNPAAAGVGVHEIVYSYISPENQCSNTCSFMVTVFALPEVTCGSDLSICLNSEPVVLENSQPAGGIYTGNGVDEGVFDPVAAGLGVHVVNYKFVDENGCSAACQFQITVNPSTTLVCPESFAMCISDDPILMSQAIPPGGSYSGTGVDGGYFDPELAGVGVHAISYDFTNGFGCHTACSFTIEVYPLPELSCSFPEEVCLYDGPIVLDGCEPDGGIYSGTGVTCNTFFPEIAGAGLHEIHYHYIHPATGCTNDASFTIRVLPAQIVSLPYGWTGISSYMITKNTEITEIFAGISDHLIILYNLTGTIWYPGGNIYPQSPWDMYSGYILKSGQGVNMNFCGDYLQNLTVQLLPGWNLVPMLSKNPVSSEFLFGFNEHIKIVKEVAGWKLLWKEMGINTLGFVVPGEAYYVYSTGATSVTFPYYAKEEPMEIKPDAIYSSPFEPVEMTPVSHLVALPCLMANLFEEGDIIAAFGESGICAGQIRMDKENTALTLFGDDQYTWEQDGMQADENVYYRMFRSSDGSYFDLEFEFDQNWQNGNHFQPEGISVVKGVTLSPSGLPDVSQHAVKLYPNPTTGVVLVTGIEGDFQIEVFNVVQEQILTLNLSGESQFDLSALPKGVYMVKIIGDGMIFTRKIVLQ